jgi:hypothetical protein
VLKRHFFSSTGSLSPLVTRPPERLAIQALENASGRFIIRDNA